MKLSEKHSDNDSVGVEKPLNLKPSLDFIELGAEDSDEAIKTKTVKGLDSQKKIDKKVV